MGSWGEFKEVVLSSRLDAVEEQWLEKLIISSRRKVESTFYDGGEAMSPGLTGREDFMSVVYIRTFYLQYWVLNPEPLAHVKKKCSTTEWHG